MLLWNRTKAKAFEFSKKPDVDCVEKISDLFQCDLILSFVNSQIQEVTSELASLDTQVLVETPAYPIAQEAEVKFGCLEQWPYLPLEQFKELCYASGALVRPYLVFNDGRSFDYHAMAQLRSYLQQELSVGEQGLVRGRDGMEWTFGQCVFTSGAVGIYHFDYRCKKTLKIPIQFIRSYSSNGAIVTGRMKELDNDYEFFDIRDANGVCSPRIERQNGVTSLISCTINGKEITWTPLIDGLNDQQLAIATLIDNALNGKIYSYKDAKENERIMASLKRTRI